MGHRPQVPRQAGVGVKLPSTEREAWAVVAKTPTRLRYEHRRSYEFRLRVHNNFVDQVKQTPDGCWVWTGPVITRSHRRYPIYYYYSREKKKTVADLSFTFLMARWFPDSPRRMKTAAGCQQFRCINPYHRVLAVRQTNVGKVLTAEQALQIYHFKGHATRKQVGEKYGISTDTVTDIWIGRTWSNVTGHVSKRESKKVAAPPRVAGQPVTGVSGRPVRT